MSDCIIQLTPQQVKAIEQSGSAIVTLSASQMDIVHLTYPQCVTATVKIQADDLGNYNLVALVYEAGDLRSTQIPGALVTPKPPER